MRLDAWDWSRISKITQTTSLVCIWAIGGGAALLALLLIVFASAQESAPVQITEISRWVEKLPRTVWGEAAFAQLAAEHPDTSHVAWQQVRLPNVIPLPTVASIPEGAPAARAWFKARYVVPADNPEIEPIAIFVPRIMGGAWSVWADGKLVAENSDDWRMQWNHPVYVSLPLSYSHPGTAIDIEIAVPYRLAEGYAVGTLWVGSKSGIKSLYTNRFFFQYTLPAVGMIVIVLMGIFSFHFWFVRRSETPHLFMALGAIAWLVFDVQYFYDIEADLLWAQWLAAVVDSSISWLFLFIYLFAARIDNRKYPILEACIGFYVVADLIFPLPIWNWQVNALLFQHWLHVIFCSLVTLHITWFAIRSRRKDIVILSLALWAMVGMGAHDLTYVSGQTNPDVFHMLPYGVFGVFLAFQYSNQRRYIAALENVEQSNQILNKRLAEREGELNVNYERLAAIEQQRTLLLERQRLMQDMHDGIGSTLMSSLAMVENGQVNPDYVASLLRECIDELRIVIHSLEPIAYDLTTLLASLRQRLGRRLEVSGIRLFWYMGDLPALPWLEAPQALQILRIMQELLTNVLKHAHATEVRINSRLETPPHGEPKVVVSVVDNGVGFDPTSLSHGRGLKNIKERSQRLYGEIRFDSAPSMGTSVELRLPVDKLPEA